MILDTNALSAFADGETAVGDVLRTQRRAAIPVVVLGEFRYGIAGSRHEAEYEAWLEATLPAFDVLVVYEGTARAYAELRVELKRAGRVTFCRSADAARSL
jgi:tRNA(fMet)-specific endonuclease VapC